MTNGAPRRILMTTDAVGGIWVYATGLARSLCAAGNRVTLVVMGPEPEASEVAALTRTVGLDVVVTDLALEWMDPEGSDQRRARDVLLRLAGQIAPHVVHLNNYREAAFAWPAPVVLTAHSCVLSWWRACRGSLPDEPRWAEYGSAVHAGLDQATAWVAPTKAFRDTIASLYAPRREGRVIHNGTDPGAPPASKEPFVLAAGRVWDEAKRLHCLVEMSNRVDWPIRIAGDPRGPKAASVALATNAHCLLGRLPHDVLAAAMRRAAVFVSPAVYEPFGLSILEAANAGCALVLSDLGSLRELWDDAALFVTADDHLGIAVALQRLCSDEELRRSLGHRAAVRARSYTHDATAARYRELYDELCGDAPCVAPPATEVAA
jgi:glycosyltransferase involved in cell wall biosynthesis